MLPLDQADYPDPDEVVCDGMTDSEPAPVVAEHAVVFRDLCDNQCQFRHVQHDLTGLIVCRRRA